MFVLSYRVGGFSRFTEKEEGRINGVVLSGCLLLQFLS